MKSLLISLCLVFQAAALPQVSLEWGLEASPLSWKLGTHTPWSLNLAFGPELSQDVYLRGRLSYPIPFFIVIGNQLSAGGELLWLPKNPDNGFTVRTSLAASWCSTWPEDVIVILADGESSEPSEPEAFENASGIRYEALLGLGWKMDLITMWVNLGLDHRKLNVRRFENNTEINEDLRFTGPHFGLGTEVRF